MIFDSHAHYDAEQFNADRDALLASLPERGVGCVIDPGCDGASSLAAVRLAERYAHVYAAVGWHPEEWESWDAHSLDTIRTLASREKVVAIGEIGLDYHWDREHKALQKEMLEHQLLLALELDLPVIIHDRDAHEDCMEAVFRHGGLRGVFHCFSGSAEMAKELLRRGWYLGFDGPITYKNNKKAAEVVAVTPPERMLIETDSPYLSPVPYRGQRNDSTHLPAVLEKLAELTGLSADALEARTWEIAVRLLGI